jgi:hypothetical protein
MEHVKAVFSRNELEEGKTKPQENETEQAMTRKKSQSTMKNKLGRSHGSREEYTNGSER